jgi:hypothetical protein
MQETVLSGYQYIHLRFITVIELLQAVTILTASPTLNQKLFLQKTAGMSHKME